MVTMRIALDSNEADALARWSEAELRAPSDQIHFVLRQKMIQLGMFSDKAESAKCSFSEADKAVDGDRP